MNSKRTWVTLMAAIMVAGASGLAAAAENAAPGAPASSMPGMGQMPMSHGMPNAGGSMHEDGMMGMMDMMHSCQQMMGGAMPGSVMPLRLPPGNEKLEFQMRAEMMQKIGEIAAKYGQQIK